MDIDYTKVTDAELLELYKNTTNVASANRNAEQALKISINAAYGALANNYFRYYDVRLAEAITLTGQAIIKYGNMAFNNYYHNTLKFPKDDYVVYCDTDSLYVNVQPIVDKFCEGKSTDQIVDFLDKVCKSKFKDMLSKSYNEFFNYTNAFESTINFKREAICSAGYWVAKKRYALKVHDNEGIHYTTPEIKITGLEIVRSSTPKIVQKALKNCVNTILSGSIEQLRKEVDTMKKAFMLASPEDIAFPRGVSDLQKYTGSGKLIYKKGTPIAVRAALLFNHYIKEQKLEGKYSRISSGDKIKYIHLKTNVIRENVLGFSNNYPIEVVDKKYIDYEEQWNKSFVDPLNSMLEAINWSLEEKMTLDEFFC